MKFSIWLENRLILEGGKGKGSKPNHMPKPESNVIKPTDEPKQRIAGGRRNTTMDSAPKRLRTRSAQTRHEIENQ